MKDYEYDFEVSESAEPFIGKVNSTEELYGLPKNMLANLIQTESGFNPEALGPETKYGKAQGITQIIPQFHPDIDPYNPEAAIDYAGEKLSEYYEEFGDWDAAIAAWNAGPTNLRKHGLDGIKKIKGFKETQNYLKKINANRRIVQSQQSLEPEDEEAMEMAGGDEWGGVSAEDEWGGTPAKEGAETDEWGGQAYEDPRDMKWEKPLPLGQRLIDNYARPVLQGLGGAAGIIIGGGGGAVGGTAVAPGPGTVAGGTAGGVIGGGMGYAIGDEIADILQEWLGYYEPVPVMMNLQEASQNVAEGMAGEMLPAAGGAVVKGSKGAAGWLGKTRAGKYLGDLLPKTEKGAKKKAGEILAAFTANGPLVAKNMEEAKALEELIPGLKFDLGQQAGDVGAIKFMKEGVNDSGKLAVARAERQAANTKAIQAFIEKTKGARDINDPLRALKSIRSQIDEIQDLTKKNMGAKQSALEPSTGPMQRGSTVRGHLEAGEEAARKKAEELFDKVPEQDQYVDDLIDGFADIMKPSHATEGKNKFPNVIEDALKAMKKGKKVTETVKKAKTAKKEPPLDVPLEGEPPTAQAYRIARSGKYTPAQARAKADIFAKESAKLAKKDPQKAMDVATKHQIWREAAEAMEGAKQHKGWDEGMDAAEEVVEDVVDPMMTLRDIQGLRSEILEDLRTAKDKGYPRSYRKRLTRAVKLIDDKLGATAGSTAEEVEVFYRGGNKPLQKGKAIYMTDDPVKASAYPTNWRALEGSTSVGSYKVKLKNPKIFNKRHKSAMISEADIKKLQKEGYDGIKTIENGELVELIAFDKSQIKQVPFKKSDLKRLSRLKDVKGIGKDFIMFEKGAKGTLKAPSQQLREAQKYFRENVIEKYGKGAVGKVLRGEETVSDAVVADAFFKSGFKGEQAASEFMKVMGDNKEAMTAMKEHIDQKIFDLRSPKTDELTKAALTRFLRNHQYAIKKLGLGKEYSSLYKARMAADRALAASKEFEKSAASKALGADVRDFIKTAFSTGSKKESAIEMMKQMDEALKPFSKADKKRAVKGLQNAFIDEITSEVPLEGTTRELFAANKMADQFRKYDPALRVVFKDNPEKIKAMHAVRKAVSALQYRTGEKAELGERYAADVFRRLAFLSGHTTVAAVDVSRKMVRALRSMSNEKVHKFVNRGVLDPEVAFELMKIAKGGSQKKIDQNMARSLVRLGLIAPQRKEEERSKR